MEVLLSRLAIALFFSLFSFVVMQWADVVNPANSARSSRLWRLYVGANGVFYGLVVVITPVCLFTAVPPAMIDVPVGVMAVGALLLCLGFCYFGVRMRHRARGLGREARARLNRALYLLTFVLAVCTLLFVTRFVVFVNALRYDTWDSFQSARCPRALDPVVCVLTAIWLPELVPCACMLALMWEREGMSHVADKLRHGRRVEPGEAHLGSPLLNHMPLLRCGLCGVRVGVERA